MNNDLISREALLKAMEEERQYLLARGQTGAEHILVHHCLPLIDNAPTVDIKDELAGAYNEGYVCGNKEAEKARLQGEWKVKTLSTFPQYQPDEYECPFCKTIVNYKTNFCHKCGANMQKGGAE